jgi:hypothetical protein
MSADIIILRDLNWCCVFFLGNYQIDFIMQDGLFSLFSVFSVGKKKFRFHPRISLLIKVFKPGLVASSGSGF